MSKADQIISAKGLITQGSAITSWDDLHDYTGICVRGPWDGYTLSDGNRIVKLDGGAYRFLDGKWWWGPLA